MFCPPDGLEKELTAPGSLSQFQCELPSEDAGVGHIHLNEGWFLTPICLSLSSRRRQATIGL